MRLWGDILVYLDWCMLQAGTLLTTGGERVIPLVVGASTLGLLGLYTSVFPHATKCSPEVNASVLTGLSMHWLLCSFVLMKVLMESY